MKASPERGWIGIAGLVAFAAILVWGAVREFRAREARGKTDRGSIFSPDASGTRALFLLLRSEGLAVTPMTRPPTAAMEKGLLVVIDPGIEMDKDAAGQVVDWIESGGAVVLAGEYLGALGLALKATSSVPTQRELGLALPTHRSDRFALATGSNSEVTVEGERDVLLRRDSAAQAVELERGQGKAVLLPDAFCATNSGLDMADNASWWVETCRRLSDGRPVMFLETVHGFAREPSIPEYFTDKGLGPFVLQLFLVAGVLVWLLGSRKAPPLAPSMLIRRPAAEYAATMAQLYRQGRSEAHAAGVALSELEAWWRRPASARAFARLDAARKAAVLKEIESLASEGRGLTGLARPGEDAVHGWVSRAAAFRRRVTGDDRE
ncbi:MAG: DUF4350 domain-containing protein [Planctomycetota bacterium]